MRPAPLPIERALQGFGRDLARFSRKANELNAAAEEFRRAAFIRGDMCLLVAQDCAPGRRVLRDCKRVCRCSCRHQKHRNIAFEHLRKPALHLSRPVIVAVGKRTALICARNRRHDFWRYAGCIVAREIHGY